VDPFGNGLLGDPITVETIRDDEKTIIFLDPAL
jgi:hypothetical protein